MNAKNSDALFLVALAGLAVGGWYLFRKIGGAASAASGALTSAGQATGNTIYDWLHPSPPPTDAQSALNTNTIYFKADPDNDRVLEFWWPTAGGGLLSSGEWHVRVYDWSTGSYRDFDPSVDAPVRSDWWNYPDLVQDWISEHMVGGQWYTISSTSNSGNAANTVNSSSPYDSFTQWLESWGFPTF